MVIQTDANDFISILLSSTIASCIRPSKVSYESTMYILLEKSREHVIRTLEEEFSDKFRCLNYLPVSMVTRHA